jgi:GNAT superfamily N-acetyltransferase
MPDLRDVLLDDLLVAPLIDGLTDEYFTRYGPNNEMARASGAEFTPPDGLFIALVVEGEVVAGGGYRRLDDGVCEVKRMWTAAAHRRQGHGSTVLSALEQRARAAGYRCVRLETGPWQPEAAALYASRGYVRIPYYGVYPDALAFELDLGP